MDTVYKALGIPAELLCKIPGIGPIVKTCCTSVGQKILMAITGLSLCGFLVAHLLGNLNLFAGEAAFNGYAEKLHSLGPVLAFAEINLFGLFALHLGLAISTRAMSARARRCNYEQTNSKQSGAVLPMGGAANMMLMTGLVLAAYIVLHVLDMKLNAGGFESGDSKFALTRAVLSHGPRFVFYLVALVFLGVHLTHGVSSALQTLGLNHPRWNKLVRILSVVFAWSIAAGFLSIVIWSVAVPPRL